MQASKRGLLALVTVVALAIGGTALAANTGSFGDPTGDAGAGPDIASVSIANDDAGTVTIRVALGDRAALGANDELLVGIDADQNPDTGSFFYGTEFGFDLTGTQALFVRPTPSGNLDGAPAPPSFQGSSAAGVATFTFKTSEVGMAPTSGFEIFAISGSARGLDAAPDIRTVNHQLVAGTPRPVLGPDRRAPVDLAIRTSGVHGKLVRLPYFAADGRGETADTIQVYRGSKVIKKVAIRLSDTNPFFSYTVPWRVPKTVKGKLRFCVSSVDRAGNKSKRSCAALTIR